MHVQVIVLSSVMTCCVFWFQEAHPHPEFYERIIPTLRHKVKPIIVYLSPLQLPGSLKLMEVDVETRAERNPLISSLVLCKLSVI